MVTFQLWVVCRSVPLFSRIFYYLCHSNIGLSFHGRKVKEKMITHREVQLLCKEIPLEQNSLKRSLPHNFHCVSGTTSFYRHVTAFCFIQMGGMKNSLQLILEVDLGAQVVKFHQFEFDPSSKRVLAQKSPHPSHAISFQMT